MLSRAMHKLNVLVAPKYRGIDLEVYPSETPVLFEDGIRNLTTNPPPADQTTAIRAAALWVPEKSSIDSLTEALSLATAEIDLIARLCGAKALGHSWGLYPIKDRKPSEYSKYRAMVPIDFRIPPGHIVVAKVDILDQVDVASTESDEYKKALEGTDEYLDLPGIRIHDPYQHQLVLGINRSHAQPLREMWYVDTEARLVNRRA